MRLLKFIVPGVLLTVFGLFYYLTYETVQELNDSYTGVGIRVNKLMVVLYTLLGRHGTFLLLTLLGWFISYRIWKSGNTP